MFACVCHVQYAVSFSLNDCYPNLDQIWGSMDLHSWRSIHLQNNLGAFGFFTVSVAFRRPTKSFKPFLRESERAREWVKGSRVRGLYTRCFEYLPHVPPRFDCNRWGNRLETASSMATSVVRLTLVMMQCFHRMNP